MIVSFNMKAQTICEGQKVIPTQTFYQCDNNPWVLVFEDNFNGNSLDLSKWTYGPRIRYCNNEQQYYTHGNNIEVSNGTLKLIAKKETLYAKAVDWLPDNEHLYCNGVDKGQNARYFYYTSGDIETIKKFSYGKYEARIKIPKGKGFWPAFWMFGGDPVYNEIDIFEFWNEVDINHHYDPSKLSRVDRMTIHYDYDNDGKPSSCGTKYNGVDFSQDFHIFTLIWEKNKIEWYVDGVLRRTDFRYYTILGQTTGCTIKAWHQYILNKIYTKDPMHIILNFAIQGGSNSPESSTIFPSQMEVDWVKYYSKHPYQNVYISGSSIVCTSNNSTFTLHNAPTNSTIIWTYSNNLTQVGGNTGTTYTVKAKNSYVNSQEWVKATVNGVEFKKTFWIGKPKFTVEGDKQLEIRMPGIAMLDYSNGGGGSLNVVWTKSGAISSVNGGPITAKFRAGSRPGMGAVYANVTNTCGSKENRLLIEVTGGYLIYPNPSNNVLNIKREESKTLKDLNTKNIEIKLYDKMMTLKKQKLLKGNLTSINVSDLQEGVYIIQLISGKKTYEEKIMISHH